MQFLGSNLYHANKYNLYKIKMMIQLGPGQRAAPLVLPRGNPMGGRPLMDLKQLIGNLYKCRLHVLLFIIMLSKKDCELTRIF